MDLNALVIRFNHNHPGEVTLADFDANDEQFNIILDREGTVRLLSEITAAVTTPNGEKPEGAENFSQSFYYLMNHMYNQYGGESIGSLMAGLEHVIMLMQEVGHEDSEDVADNDYTILVNQYGATAVAIEEQ